MGDKRTEGDERTSGAARLIRKEISPGSLTRQPKNENTSGPDGCCILETRSQQAGPNIRLNRCKLVRSEHSAFAVSIQTDVQIREVVEKAGSAWTGRQSIG